MLHSPPRSLEFHQKNNLMGTLSKTEYFTIDHIKLLYHKCMLLSCHVRVLEQIYTLSLPERQGTPCSKQARYLKFK